jgi:hypothetical protein
VVVIQSRPNVGAPERATRQARRYGETVAACDRLAFASVYLTVAHLININDLAQQFAWS